MKLLRVGFVAFLVLSAVCVPLAFAVSDHGLPWWSADGGGGSSSGGAYAVVGSIGQPDAGSLSSGGYAASGGLWQAIPPATPTPTATSTAIPSATPNATQSPTPTVAPTLGAGGPPVYPLYLPLILR